MSDSIKVAIKVRPFIKREKDDNLAIQWVVQENSIISTDPEMKKRGDGGFVFDHIFDMNASNSDVFNTVVKPIVNAAVNGINGTVFAYGQTSSGKTYTMMGIEEEPGIVPLAVQHMFDAIANTTGREFLLRVSYLEIYNERVNDLLNKSGTDLKIKEDGSGQVVLQCKEEITNSPENVLSIMKKGDKKRRIGETNMNERSSRSHTIFRITVESREAGGDSDSAIQVSQLNLVDLAGSERARQTGATGERFKEGRHINLSLSTLSLVIMQLSESQDGQKHVNFRDSKLTRLLQSSLGGNAMTAIICAVTPAALEETQCTLSFASRAKSVRNKPQINEVMSDAALLKRYAKQLSKLQEELQRIKNENRSAEVEEMESKLQEKERINQLLEERIELLKTRILSGDNISQEDLIKRKSKRRQTWGGPGIFNQHLSTFQSKSGLPTINEVSFEKPQRKSIIQPMDIMNQTFQTAFADFELELFESERDRESRETISDSDEELFITKHKNRVTFRDDVSIRSKNNSFDVTPEKCNMFTQTIDYQASPSTPKHVLRQCITDLTREFVQLREFTTLEKQLICQENHCHAQEGEEYSPETDLKQTEQIKSISKYKGEYIPEVKEQLANLNLAEEKNLVRIITELCIKLNEVQKQNISEEELRLKTMKQFSELEKKIENITSERNEYEYMSCELRAELKKRTAELELKIMSEENTKQEEMKKISGIEKQIETTISKKNEFERINAELTKKFTELQKQIENVTSERNEFEHMHRELRMELNKKSIELERFSNNSENANIELVNNKIIELETKVENITYEKDKFKQMNDDLRVELKCISSEFESKITSKQTEKQNAIEKVSELEKYIEQILSSKNELEQDNIEIKSKLDNKIIDLESKIEFEQILNQKVLEFEKQIEKIISDKNEIECMNRELNKNILGLKSTILSQQTIYQEANDKISDLEQKLENAVSEKNEFQRVNIDLHTTLNKKCSDLEEKIISKETENLQALEKISEFEKQIMNITSEKKELERINNELQEKIISKETENLQALEKISEFEKQIMNITSEKKELERINNELRIEMEQKVSEQEEKIIATQNENQKIIEKISDLETQIESKTLEKDKYEQKIYIKNSESKLKSECDCINKNNNNQKNYIEELQNIVTNLQIENQGMKDQLGNYSILSSSEMDKTNADTSHLILNMETEKCQLEENLQLKCQELEDIRNDVQSLTTDIKKLEETIYLLTTENTEMATRLTTEQENAKQTELYLQKTIEELYARISEVTNEKITLDTDLATLNDQLNSMRSKMSVMYNEEQLFGSYQIKINKLTMENIELSTSITEKNKELENIKESKSLLYDHDCIYKEKIAIITEKNDYLLLENSELSTDLIDKIEENDMLKEQCNILKSKIEQLLTMNENVTGNDMEHLKMTNNTLNAEIAELKTKVTILSEENVKFSSNLLETIDNLDSSQNEKSCNNSLHLSKIFNSSTDVNETEQKIPQEETCETLINKVVTLENKIDHLVRLNKKLSDLKLTSCSQCVHLRNLNESRRALKFETKVLNQKLEDLQRKFDRKCADTEILKNKIDQELNSSEHDESLNITFVNEMNVSFVEARIESLNDELQTLKIDHDKLLVLYEDKCDELKQLQSDVIINATNPDDPTSRKSLDKTGNRIEQIQNCIDHLKNDMDKMKESSKNFTAVLNEVKTEKANLLNEINSLKDINEELQQKILNNESMALKKLQILENELTNMSGEIEQFSTREKGLETQRLMLEVELESLRVEEQNKNVLINQLNERVTSLKSTIECKEKELQHLRKQYIIKDSKRKQYNTIRSDRDINKYESKCNQLEKKIHELELQLVSKNGKIATLEIQIQSENFPYQRKCKELEEVVLAFRSKNAELSNEVRKLRKTVNDVNTWECDVCRRWYVNRKDQACQTIPNNAVRFCSTNSGVVEDHVKIQKLEKEKMLMKDLCRSRSRQIKELQDRIKELEEAQNSPTLRMHEILQDRSNQQDNNATKFKRHLDVGKNSKS
ncbi:Centromere-associated protein E [Eufriesea mexicana]|uniref:Centromere-associated protein E n=1 Tax=Eufriesea mexicana TaxID=516756 RepID=A0A310SSG8_9HYME|nr:Centromere-associated protein E [Eufriesea mexicana]